MNNTKDKELLKQIARRCKELREQIGVSQEEVLNETNIHIGRIEMAEINVTASTLKVLCTYFDISLGEFFKDFK